MSERPLQEQDVIKLLGELKDQGIEYPAELLEKRRNHFKKAIAAIGGTIIAWSFLGFKGAIKITSTMNMILKGIVIAVLATEVVGLAVIYQDDLRNLIFNNQPGATEVQLQPFGSVLKTTEPTRTPYPTPTLAPSLTVESTYTVVAPLTSVAGSSSSTEEPNSNAGNVVNPTPTDDGPPYGLGLTKTPKPQNEP